MECPGWGPEELCREQLSAFGLRPLRPERDRPVSGGRHIDSLVVNRKKKSLSCRSSGSKDVFQEHAIGNRGAFWNDAPCFSNDIHKYYLVLFTISKYLIWNGSKVGNTINCVKCPDKMDRRSDRVKLSPLTIQCLRLDCEKSRFYFYSSVQKQPLMTKVLHELLIIQKINYCN